MTVIAFRDGVMAADSAVSLSGYHMSYGSVDKIVSVNGWLAGAAGGLSHAQQFFRWIGGSKRQPDWSKIQAIVVRPDGRIFEFDCFPDPIKIQSPYGVAIGSGMNTAIAAMMAGADAITAVQITAALDHECGGPVKSLSVNAAK